MKKVLIACEYSGRVRAALRAKGVDAWSCDILASDDDSQYHIQGDLREVLQQHQWFAVIAFPPCTHLAVSGARHFHKKEQQQRDALAFVQMLFDYDCEYLCIENPIGIISTKIKKPSQYIQPYEFGHPMSKKTCLWLRGLPKLQGTNNVYDQVNWQYYPSGKRMCSWYSKSSAHERSKTFENIATQMAEQWHTYLI
jgi:site-specific DNA-cytosine methylase